MNQKGVSLLEALIALALLGLIAVAFLGGLFTTSKATFTADEQATALSLAQSQIEYVKSQDYINYADSEHRTYELIITPDNYNVEIASVPIDGVTGQPLSLGQDQGIQKITVTIKHLDKEVTELEAYKVER